MGDRTHVDEVFGVARQLALASGPLVRNFSYMRATLATDAIRDSLARTAKLNTSLLASTQQIRTAQMALSIDNGQLASIMDANSHLQDVVGKMGILKLALPVSLAAQIGSGRAMELAGLSGSIAGSYLQLNASTGLAASMVAQLKLTALRTVPLGGLIQSDSTFRRSTSAHLGRVTRAYESLMGAALVDRSLADYIPAVTSYPPVDYYRHVEAIQSITLPIDGEQYSSESILDSLDLGAPTVDDVLLALDPALHPLLIGARQALQDDNPERPRYITTSLREVMTQVLRRLAPDTDVKNWSTSSSDYHDGRPTRRARLMYICRRINSGPFMEFVDADVSAALALVKSLNAGTHTITSELTGVQLEAMISRVESLLLFLLRLSEAEWASS
ncbi:MAG: hypothetical protein FD171_1277 [Actinobacteria bacterium]|nr:MAG: hypothetical protein FD171_1277 [Actinomycetota bacterium]